MHKFLLSLFFLCFSQLMEAQGGPKSKLKLTYEGYISLGASEPKVNNFEAYVLIGDTLSACWQDYKANYNPTVNDSVIQVKTNDLYKNLVNKYSRTQTSTFGYSSIFLKAKYNYYSDTIFPFKWEITPVTKKIDTLTCLKALSIYRGRAYIAWFTPSIPISEGPWKFGGLPGLIIEVYDENKDVYWRLTSIKPEQVEIPVAKQQPKGNFDFFVKEMKAGYKRVVASLQAEDNVDPSCIKCKTDMKITVNTLENIFEY